jgi:hypothetical protein
MGLKNAYQIFVAKPEGKRPLGRPRNRWEDNIRMDVREIGLIVVNWLHVVQDRDQWQVRVNIMMSFRVP